MIFAFFSLSVCVLCSFIFFTAPEFSYMYQPFVGEKHLYTRTYIGHERLIVVQIASGGEGSKEEWYRMFT